jgi:hypothetical protein
MDWSTKFRRQQECSFGVNCLYDDLLVTGVICTLSAGNATLKLAEHHCHLSRNRHETCPPVPALHIRSCRPCAARRAVDGSRIANEVIYLVTGEIVRHSDDTFEKLIQSLKD